jgi:uncharacterized protein Yka (UPF0111/DUF47 family)
MDFDQKIRDKVQEMISFGPAEKEPEQIEETKEEVFDFASLPLENNEEYEKKVCEARKKADKLVKDTSMEMMLKHLL